MEDRIGINDDDSPEQMAARLRELFREEAYQLIAELENAILEIEKTPGDREQIGRVFRAMHTIKGSGAACGMNDISAFTHEIESFYDLVRKDNLKLTRELVDLTLAARDQIKAMLDACYYGGIVDEERSRAIIESFRRSSVSIGSTRTGAAVSEPASRTAGSGVQDERDGDALKTTAAVLEQERDSASPSAASLSSIRVATDKLDTLVDLVGELVTIQARLSQTALSSGVPEFLAIAEEVERLTGNLRDETMSIRMMPIGATFSRFKRLVRDLAQELGKEAVLVTEGAETELDKTVIERLGEPLDASHPQQHRPRHRIA